jgi:hypothetical protein
VPNIIELRAMPAILCSLSKKCPPVKSRNGWRACVLIEGAECPEQVDFSPKIIYRFLSGNMAQIRSGDVVGLHQMG